MLAGCVTKQLFTLTSNLCGFAHSLNLRNIKTKTYILNYQFWQMRLKKMYLLSVEKEYYLGVVVFCYQSAES